MSDFLTWFNSTPLIFFMQLSIIIPAYKEPHLLKTIQSLLDTSELDIEILPVLDGPWFTESFPADPRIVPIRIPHLLGMRNAINTGLKQAKGEYIMKVDAHCLFDQGFDRKMVKEMKDDWLMVPRRYSLDETNWRRDEARPFRDYHYIEYPHKTKYGEGLTIMDWLRQDKKEIDDTMIFQGSCWLAKKDYFMKHVGYLDEQKYGSFVGEQHEIGLKYWLGGGKIKVNKKTWYAHLSKRPKHYDNKIFDRRGKTAPETERYHTWCANHWMNDGEPGMTRTFADYINQFNPPSWKIPYK